MSAPFKPWERDFVGAQGVDQRMRLESSATLPTMMGSARPVRLQQLPSVPARPWLNRSQSRLNSYGFGTSNPYMNGGYGTYGGYGGYGSYGAYGGYGGYRNLGVNRYGMQGSEDPENRFIQIAEEATRPAFDSIQSVVDAFGSVSYMLESTYQAVVHTFRAVLGIAEHLGQLRSIFAAVNVFRLVRWAYGKLCQMLGVKTSTSKESIWHDAAAAGDNGSMGLSVAEPSTPRWPIFVYFTIVVSGPLLMWRLLKSLSLDNTASRVWDPKMEPPSQFAMVIYPFTAQTDKELSINAGRMVGLAPNNYQSNWSSGWVLVTADRKTTGLVPLNYMQQVQHVPNPKQVPGATPVSNSNSEAATNKTTASQQYMHSFPVVTDINASQAPIFPPVASTTSSTHMLVNDPGETVPVVASTPWKLDPAAVSLKDLLPTQPVLEEKPVESVVRQESESSSQTVGVEQTEMSTPQPHPTDKAS